MNISIRRSCGKYEHRDNFNAPVHEVAMRECPDCYREALERQHTVLLQFAQHVANSTGELSASDLNQLARNVLAQLKEIRE